MYLWPASFNLQLFLHEEANDLPMAGGNTGTIGVEDHSPPNQPPRHALGTPKPLLSNTRPAISLFTRTTQDPTISTAVNVTYPKPPIPPSPLQLHQPMRRRKKKRTQLPLSSPFLSFSKLFSQRHMSSYKYLLIRQIYIVLLFYYSNTLFLIKLKINLIITTFIFMNPHALI